MATDLHAVIPPNAAGIGDINKYDFRTESTAVFKARRGIDAEIVTQISSMKNEPAWMLEFRLKSLEIFNSKPMPRWGGTIGVDFQNIFYYLKPAEQQGKTWDEVPEEIKKTFERLGIPEAERKYLSGVKAQFESEVVYGSLQEDLAKKVSFLPTPIQRFANILILCVNILPQLFLLPTINFQHSTPRSGREVHLFTYPKGSK